MRFGGRTATFLPRCSGASRPWNRSGLMTVLPIPTPACRVVRASLTARARDGHGRPRYAFSAATGLTTLMANRSASGRQRLVDHELGELENLAVRPKWQAAGHCQFGDAVNHRPRE